MAVPSGLQGPARFFAVHPTAHTLSLLGAILGGVVFAFRGVRSGGCRRFAWWTLTVSQIVQVLGIWSLRPRPRRF